MKMLLILMIGLFSLGALARSEISFTEHVKVRTVKMENILLNDLTHLYSELYFSQVMLADEKEIRPQKNEKKSTWSEKLRMKMGDSEGVYRI